MLTVAYEIHRALARPQQKREGCLVLLQHVTGATAQHEVVAPVEGRLSAPWRHMIQRHDARRESRAAVRASGPMLLQQPCPRVGIRIPACGMRRELHVHLRRSLLAPTSSGAA